MADTCDLLLGEHDDSLLRCSNAEHRTALERRSGGAPKWSTLERRHKHGDFRDYLDGTPIHCGEGLELQAIEYRSDDYGQFALPLATGVHVRYELDWRDQKVTLYGSLGGHEFTIEARGQMRFRWPARGGR